MAMNKYEKTVVALLAIIAVSGTVTAVEVVRMARIGFNVELTEPEAQDVINAGTVAVPEMIEEGE